MTPTNIDGFLGSRPLLLDIETSGLKADYGIVLVVGVREFTRDGPGLPVYQWKIDRTAKDWVRAEKLMLSAFRDLMARRIREGNVGIITYNGSRFDIPFLQARFMVQGIPMLPKLRHVDLFYTVKNTVKYTVTSRRAKYIQTLFKLGDHSAPFKDSSEPMTWTNAVFARSRAAFDRIVDHNRNECLVALLYQTRRLAGLCPRTVALR